MNYKISKFFLIVGIISIITTFILLAFNTFLKADDYCFRVQMANQNPFLVLWDHYINHDGRAFSPINLLRNLLVKLMPPEVNSLFSTLSLFGISFFIVAYVNKIFNQNENKNLERLLITLLVTACLWLGIRANLSRVIYWPVGNYYIYAAFFLFGALYYLLCNSERKKIILFGVFSVFAGVNLAFSFLITYLLYIIIFKNKNIKNELNILLIFLVAFFFMFLAPGNFARASRLESGYDFNVFNILKNYFIIFIEYLMMSKWILITSFLSAFLFNISNDDKSYQNNKLLNLSLLMILGALLTIVPFVILPQAATRHTSIYFQLLLFLGILLFALYVRSSYLLQKKYLTNSVTFLIIIIFLYEGIQQYILSSDLKNKIIQRELILNNADKSHPVNITEITSNPRLYSHFYKDYPEEKWTIECMESYYKLDSINIIKK
jgi:hypothetical protein